MPASPGPSRVGREFQAGLARGASTLHPPQRSWRPLPSPDSSQPSCGDHRNRDGSQEFGIHTRHHQACLEQVTRKVYSQSRAGRADRVQNTETPKGEEKSLMICVWRRRARQACWSGIGINATSFVSVEAATGKRESRETQMKWGCVCVRIHKGSLLSQGRCAVPRTVRVTSEVPSSAETPRLRSRG